MIPPLRPIPGLLDFIRAWVPDLSTKHQVPSSSIPDFVPSPLRAIYELTGNWPVPYGEQWRAPEWTSGLFGTQDRLLPLDQLEVRGDRFTFIHENQYVWTCETRILEEDPPVYSDAASFDGSGDGMREVCPSLAHFLTTFCLHELTFGSMNLYSTDANPAKPGDLVKAPIKELWTGGMYAYKGAKFSFYLCEGRLLIMNTGMGTDGDYWIAFNQDEDVRLLDESQGLSQIH